MSTLQWALLVVSVVIVVALVVVSRREKASRMQWDDEPPSRWNRPDADAPRRAAEPAPTPAAPRQEAPGRAQMEIFDRPQAYDEFGVGKARRRSADEEAAYAAEQAQQAASVTPPEDDEPPITLELGEPPEELAPPPPPPRDRPTPSFLRAPSQPAPQAPAEPVAPPAELPPLNLGQPTRRAPTLGAPPEAAPPPPLAPPPAPAKPKIPDKIVTLMIVESSGAQIPGHKLHRALHALGLEYGFRQIYHRLSGEQPVFSVASLTKPGILDPDEAEAFSTLGLQVFMVLPGPVKAIVALQDMLDTAAALGRALNAEVITAQREILDNDQRRAILADVESWLRQHNSY